MTGTLNYIILFFALLLASCDDNDNAVIGSQGNANASDLNLQTDELRIPEACLTDDIYGSWDYIKMYDGQICSIDTLPKTLPKKGPFGSPVQTYNPDSTFVSDQGDYRNKGSFIIDKMNCIIKEFGHGSKSYDTLRLQISYLDKNYLVLTKINERPYSSWFYKRK